MVFGILNDVLQFHFVSSSNLGADSDIGFARVSVECYKKRAQSGHEERTPFRPCKCQEWMGNLLPNQQRNDIR